MAKESKSETIVIKTVITLGILIAIIVVVGGLYASNIFFMVKAGEQAQMPLISVATAEAAEMEWPVESAAIGTVTPAQGVTLSVELPGTVVELAFESGQTVQRGDVLARLDSSSERAQLAAAEAARDLARLSLTRAEQLLERRTISQSEFDAASAEYKQSAATVDSIKAAIDKKEIVAPFDGRLGIRRIHLGQYLNAGEPVVALQSIDPIYATFYLPQKDLSYLRPGLKVAVASDAFAGKEVVGEVSAVNSEIDPRTRMVEAQATLPNPDGLLAAGMFVNVRIEQAAPRSLLAVPTSSVLYASYGNSIYVVEPAKEGEGHTAMQKFVKLGERRGDYVEALEGLEPGQRVVTDGAFKLYPGAGVTMEDERAPESSLTPSPEDS